MSRYSELVSKESELSNKVNNIRTVIMPLVNLILIPFSYFLLYYFDYLNVVESISLGFLILFINLHILDFITVKKANDLQFFISKKILPKLFSQYFDKFEINVNQGLSIKDIKKSDLLSVKKDGFLNIEDYMKVEYGGMEIEMSDVGNSVHGMEYSGGTVDCGVLMKIKTDKYDFKFIIRHVGDFDYTKDYFILEKIHLFETKNEDFNKKYSCYTNNENKFADFLTEDLMNYLMETYNVNRIELSNNSEHMFLFVNNLNLDFGNKYNDDYSINIKKIEEDSVKSIERILSIIKKLRL